MRARVGAVVAAVLALAVVASGCQLDVVVDVDVAPDGTGVIVVVAEADAELVERVPTIADDLVLDDVRDAGWEVAGPEPAPDGGLTLTLTHGFEGEDEATNLLRSLGPPFNDPVLGRRQDNETATNTVRANLGLPDGFASFADDDLVSAVGGVPFADEFEEQGADPTNSMSAILRVSLPGEAVAAGTDAAAVIGGDGSFEWTVPLDGSIVEATAETEQAPDSGAAWARPLSIAALVAFWVWVALMTLFIGYVAVARWRRMRRYRRRGLPLADRRRI